MRQPRFFVLVLPLILLLYSCSPTNVTPPPGLPFLITLTPAAPSFSEPQNTPGAALASEVPNQPPATASVAATLPAFNPTASLSPSPLTSTPTAGATYIPYLPTPTETLLPPLELPTEQPRAPALVAWTGLPTYPGDSDPGLLFRMEYDPDTWAQTEGNFGDVVLANRQIEYCTITPWTGRGLPVKWKVAHEFRVIGLASFDVNTVTDQDVLKFVSYVGGDGRILTGFQVSFNEQPELCLQQAEVILGTLRSFAASPTSTPTALNITPTP